MSNARGNPGHAVGTTAIAWRGSMVWQGFRRRWLGPDPAVGHAVCCAVRCKMKGNCWVTVQIEDIVHRRLKEYIYIYTEFPDFWVTQPNFYSGPYYNNPSILVLGRRPSSALLSVV